MTEIGNELNCSSDTIREYLIKYNIELHEYKQKTNIDDIDLYDLYINQKQSINQICLKYGSSFKTVKKKLNELNISVRDKSDAQLADKNIDRNALLLDKDWLTHKYIEENIGATELGKILGHNARIVKRYLVKHGVTLRNNSESKIGLLSGNKHPNWQNGKTSLVKLCREYFNTNISPKIMERDNYTCQLCGKQHCILHVHHIYSFSNIIKDIIKENNEENTDLTKQENKERLYNIIIKDDKFNNSNNLITYCKECHYFKIHKYTKRQSAAKPLIEEGSTTIENTL